MENEEKILNPEESLRIIRETIDVAKKGVQENGFHFLLWGWLVVLASLGEYYLRQTRGGTDPYLVWAIMPLIGVPAALIYEWRRDKKHHERNLVREWYGLVWAGFAVSLVLSLVLAIRNQVSPVPLVMTLAAFATFVSGLLMRFRPLVFGATVLWLGAAVCLALPMGVHVLVQAGGIVLGYLVPGYMLNYKARQNHV